MPGKILLITPPFTQLNTPYPATSYLKGFLEAKGIFVVQQDLSIELFKKIYTSESLKEIFNAVDLNDEMQFSEIYNFRNDYISKVDIIIKFLQNPESTAAYQILNENFLPKGHRIQNVDDDLSWAFGNLGILDKAKHLATLFVEEIGDFIQGNIDEYFAFTKYAERIASSASSFDQLEDNLNYDPTLIESYMFELLDNEIKRNNPILVGFSIPFPGNLYAALKCAQQIRYAYPKIKIVFGGGYCNTELRSLSDPRIFQYTHFITLDDGEGPLLRLFEYVSDMISDSLLERTFLLKNGQVFYQNHIPNTIYHHSNLPAPDYSDLKHNEYISFLDVLNPMHRMWSDGKWNKLTISHGCYWKKCTFCDVGLDYISGYQVTTADDLVEKIQSIIDETNIRGFHFVDEAAPPKILSALAKKLIEKNLHISWWTNIRFERTFDNELCELLAKSGCIAVTGGLEVASDRLLKLIKKGVDIKQVSKVTDAFAQNGIMVHAYLMYGFPTQTTQETVDALEVVRQLFLNGCIHSAYWHKFTTTIHSPIGMNPDDFNIKILGPKFEGFAQNDLWHEDPLGTNHDDFTEGLNEALHSFLNGLGLDVPLQEWFDIEIPETTLDPELIASYLDFVNE